MVIFVYLYTISSAPIPGSDAPSSQVARKTGFGSNDRLRSTGLGRWRGPGGAILSRCIVLRRCRQRPAPPPTYMRELGSLGPSTQNPLPTSAQHWISSGKHGAAAATRPHTIAALGGLQGERLACRKKLAAAWRYLHCKPCHWNFAWTRCTSNTPKMNNATRVVCLAPRSGVSKHHTGNLACSPKRETIVATALLSSKSGTRHARHRHCSSRVYGGDSGSLEAAKKAQNDSRPLCPQL